MLGDNTPARRTLLFLFADTGGGHRASAAAVAGALATNHDGGYQAVMCDPFAELSPRLLTAAVELYSPLIRRAPWAWGALWHATDSRLAVRMLRAGPLRLVEPGIRSLVAAHRPAAVVSFHPLLNDVAVHALRGTRDRPRLATVVTDLVDVHASWTCPDVDLVIAASPGGHDHCRRAGIPASRCVDLGLPVDAAFTSLDRGVEAQAALRRRLGLDDRLFTVLLTGGGEGSGGLERRVRALLGSRLPLQLVVVCGRNASLRERLVRLAPSPPGRLHVEGFVDTMAALMRAADVVVTKAGPATIAESLCAGTPLLLTGYVPGQERGNVALVVDTGSGRYVPRSADLVDAVAELLVPGSPALAAMREEIRHAARPTAARRIADRLVALAEGRRR